MKTITTITTAIILFSFTVNNNLGKSIYHQINSIRINPYQYFNSKDTVLSGYTPVSKLIWDDSLAIECQKYAQNLLEKDRLIHSQNKGYLESIGVNRYEDAIIDAFLLEIGANEGEDGHRNHLLSKNNAHTRIGIGIAKGRDRDSEWLPVYYVVIRTY